MKRLVIFGGMVILSLNVALARDWFVSAERGKGCQGTREELAADLGNTLSQLRF